MAGTPTFAVDTVGRMSDARKSPPFSLPIRSARKKVSLAKSPTFFELSAVQESDDDSPRISSSSSPSSSSPLWSPPPFLPHRPPPIFGSRPQPGMEAAEAEAHFLLLIFRRYFYTPSRRTDLPLPPRLLRRPFRPLSVSQSRINLPSQDTYRTAERTQMPPPRFAPFLPPLPLNTPREKIPQFVQRENLFVAVFFSCRAAFTVHFTVLSCPVAIGPFSWENSPFFSPSHFLFPPRFSFPVTSKWVISPCFPPSVSLLLLSRSLPSYLPRRKREKMGELSLSSSSLLLRGLFLALSPVGFLPIIFSLPAHFWHVCTFWFAACMILLWF